jgi:hypothetical protein
MGEKKRRVSRDCVEQLHTWTMAHCPCALEDPETMPGYIAIVAEEVKKALAEERREFLRKVNRPSDQ